MTRQHPQRTGKLLFDLSNVDWDDDNAIEQAAQLIWTIATDKWGDDTHAPHDQDGEDPARDAH